jgi:hypothetical protein
MNENVFQHIDGDAYVVKISPDLQKVMMEHRDSVTLNFDGSNFYLSEYNEHPTVLYEDSLSKQSLESRILARKLLEEIPVQSHLSYSYSSKNLGSMGNTSRISANLSKSFDTIKISDSPEEYEKILEQMNIRTLKSLGSEDIELSQKEFDAKVFAMFVELQRRHPNVEKYFMAKISPSPQLRIDGNLPVHFKAWWDSADWKKKLFLLSAPKDSNRLIIPRDAQNWVINRDIPQDSILKLRTLIEGLPFFRAEIYNKKD